MLNFIRNYYPDSKPASPEVKEVIKVLNKFESPSSREGHISYVVQDCLLHVRTVYEYRDYFMIRMNSNLHYCRKEEI